MRGSLDNSWLAMVALRDAAVPDLQRVFEKLHGTWQDAPLASEIRQRDNAATCRWGEAVIGVTKVPHPMPPEMWQIPCENAWYWPEAGDAFQQHVEHLLVQLVDESRDIVAKALRLTQLVAAIVQTATASGVLWAPGGTVHDVDAFVEQATQSSSKSLPLYLWLDFRVQQHDGGKVSLFTTGLRRFGKPELELQHVAAQPQQILESAYNVAHYVLTRTSVVSDGDTIGLPDGSQLLVRLEPSSTGDGSEIMRMELDS